jgi:hypothetical protein
MHSLELPRVLGAFTLSPSRERASISSPISSASTPQIPTQETLQSVKELIFTLMTSNGDKSQWKSVALKTLMELVEVAEQKSVMQAMQILLVAMYPSSLYDKYSTPDKPSEFFFYLNVFGQSNGI